MFKGIRQIFIGLKWLTYFIFNYYKLCFIVITFKEDLNVFLIIILIKISYFYYKKKLQYTTHIN